MTKNLAQSRDNAEQLKVKHDTDIAHARKHKLDSLATNRTFSRLWTLQRQTLLVPEDDFHGIHLLHPVVAMSKTSLLPLAMMTEDVFGATGQGSTNRRNLDVSGLFQVYSLLMNLALISLIRPTLATLQALPCP